MISIINKSSVVDTLPKPFILNDRNDFEWNIYDMKSYYIVEYKGDMYFVDSIEIDGDSFKYTLDTYIKVSVYNERVYRLLYEIIINGYTDDIFEKFSDIMK